MHVYIYIYIFTKILLYKIIQNNKYIIIIIGWDEMEFMAWQSCSQILHYHEVIILFKIKNKQHFNINHNDTKSIHERINVSELVSLKKTSG